MTRAELRTPPDYCQYANGPCDQTFDDLGDWDALFLYANEPRPIAVAIEEGVKKLRVIPNGERLRTWKDLPIQGQIIFNEICKGMRGSRVVVADVTTLNFNLLFEIGFAIGLGLPVIPIRDTTYMADQKDFDAIGLLDTFGYTDFTNSTELAEKLGTLASATALPPAPTKTYTETPLYVLKGPIETEGAVLIMSTLKKSGLRFRTHDPRETSRLSLSTARKQISGSVGVVANLLSNDRAGSTAHNGVCALLCGMAMAEQKVVVMLQEGQARQPIDYRDVVQSYDDPRQVVKLLEEPIRETVDRLQSTISAGAQPPSGLLARVDLGDVAAENEIVGLRDYFVRTGAFRQARDGRARLVVGRKGAGKTAIFYEVRDTIGKGRSQLVLDMKPDGHHFTKLREVILEELPPGLQEHTVVAFWNYILLTEIAFKILYRESHFASRDPDRLKRYKRLEDACQEHQLPSGGDLSQRLLRQVDRLIDRFGDPRLVEHRKDLTELIYAGDVNELDNAVSEYLAEKESVWLLVDNIDKSWATRATSTDEILIVRGLLEATRKLQRQLEARGVEFKCLVFLRTDIYEHLGRLTPDRGKDSAIRLDLDDPEVLQQILKRRIETSTELDGDFTGMWRTLFESHIGAEESFNYMLERTMMRPRDLLTFVQRAFEVALNRGHEKVLAGDIRHAEQSYSEDMLLATAFEIDDTHPILSDVVYAFQSSSPVLSQHALEHKLADQGLPDGAIKAATELLLWFSFLGSFDPLTREEKYSYHVRFNLKQLTHAIENGSASYVIHPAFRPALGLDAIGV